MSSINPILLISAALKARGEAPGQAFVGSLIMGAGQFYTNPGLLLAIEVEGLDAFVAAATRAVTAAPPSTMLTTGIHAAYANGIEALVLAEVDLRDGAGLHLSGQKEGGTGISARLSSRLDDHAVAVRGAQVESPWRVVMLAERRGTGGTGRFSPLCPGPE